MEKLKLFVVGEASADPAKWRAGGGDRAFVIANDEQEACAMVAIASFATEIPLTKPILLCIESIADDL